MDNIHAQNYGLHTYSQPHSQQSSNIKMLNLWHLQHNHTSLTNLYEYTVVHTEV